MTQMIYSYQITSVYAHYQIYKMPKDAVILEVGMNPITEQPCFYALVDATQPYEKRVFCRFDVGDAIPHDMRDLTLVGRTIGASKSKSTPGKCTLRNTFWFEARREAAARILAMEQALEGLSL